MYSLKIQFFNVNEKVKYMYATNYIRDALSPHQAPLVYLGHRYNFTLESLVYYNS